MIRRFTKSYEWLILLFFTLIPLMGVAYLHLFQDPRITFEHHAFHEIAILVVILQGAFIATVTWYCYRTSGETLLYWLTLGFMGFAMIYLPHGLFTRFAHHNMWFFLLYGPVSRAVMCALLLCGLLTYGQSTTRHKGIKNLLAWGGIFVLINLGIAAVAWSPIAGHHLVRTSIEGCALLLALAGVVLILFKRISSSLIHIYAAALALFAQSSIAFFYGFPWNHLWWFAHLVFASGFFILSLGVVKAFHSARTFSGVYSQEELMAQLSSAKNETELALEEARRANQQLMTLATTDPLTGSANRRSFFEKIQTEMSRAARYDKTFVVLAMDIDHFKRVNDRYGHPAGDEVLKCFVCEIHGELREIDVVGRFGGEEFMVLLPATTHKHALVVAERIRQATERMVVKVDTAELQVTVSIGIAEYDADGSTSDELFRVADERLYLAKQRGRNQVVGRLQSLAGQSRAAEQRGTPVISICAGAGKSELRSRI